MVDLRRFGTFIFFKEEFYLMRRSTLAALVLGFSLVAGGAFANTSGDVSADAVVKADPEKVLAVVGKTEVKQKDVDEILAKLDPQRAAFFATEDGRKKLVEELVNRELFLQWGVESGVEKQEEVQKEMKSKADDVIRNYALKGLLDAVTVTSADVKAYYDAHQDEFKIPESVRARHILVASEDQIKAIAAELKGGLDFAEAAKKYSSCPSKEQGGDLGFFSAGQMVPEFEKVAFALVKSGDVSEPVKTQFGWHIIKLEEKKAAGVAPFEEVQESLQQKVLMEAQKAAYDKKVEELRKQFDVKIN